VTTFLAINSRQQLVPFRAMAGFCAHMKTLGMVPKNTFNTAFHEVHTGKESYQKVGAWVPLLGNNKPKLPYKEAIQATCRIHNFILNTENLLYSALESPEMHFSNYH
jgi:hypothetical protein